MERNTVRGGIAEERGVRAYQSFEALLDDVQVVHVCAPAVAHEPARRRASTPRHQAVSRALDVGMTP